MKRMSHRYENNRTGSMRSFLVAANIRKTEMSAYVPLSLKVGSEVVRKIPP